MKMFDYFGFTSCSLTYLTKMLGSAVGSGGFSNSSRYEQPIANVLPSLLKLNADIDVS
jgi:hypothetical protein